MAGETGPIAQEISRTTAMVIAGFFAVAIYNTVEILIWAFHSFKRRRGLYFWSMMVATLGIMVHTIAAFLRFFALAPNLLMCVIIDLGWWAMVTGQSVVLYSRLHLVVNDARKIRWVLVMIITNFCVLHVPVSILFLLSNATDPASVVVNVFNIYERIQLAVFSLQEAIISGLYLWEARACLKPILMVKGDEGKHMMRYLVILFLVTVLMDASLMATEYSNNFQIQTTYKPVLYSIKLKMEFAILNKLLSITRMGSCNCRYVANFTGSSSTAARDNRALGLPG